MSPEILLTIILAYLISRLNVLVVETPFGLFFHIAETKFEALSLWVKKNQPQLGHRALWHKSSDIACLEILEARKASEDYMCLGLYYTNESGKIER